MQYRSVITHYFPMKRTQLFYLIGLIIQLLPLNLMGNAKDNFHNLPPACNGSINISLDENCQAELTPDVLLEAPDNTLSYRIFITYPEDSTGNYTNNGTDKVTILKTGTYEFSVIDNLDNTCSGQILAEDKLLPFFTSLPRDTFVSCVIDLTEAGLGTTAVNAMDNCEPVTITYISSYIEDGVFPCDTSIVATLWKATDASGNFVIDTQRTVFIQPSLDQLIFPNDIVLSCGEDDVSDIDNLDKTGPIKTQLGKIVNGVFMPTDTIPLDGTGCGLGFSKTDDVTSVDCKIKVTRSWEILDWCMPTTRPIIIDTQIIEYKDTLAPIFDAHENGSLANPRRIELGANCQFEIALIEPTATDNCDTLVHIEMYEVAQLMDGIWTIIGESTNTMDLPADTFRIGYRAFDECHTQLKEDSTFTYVITTDLTAPAVICASDLVISITGDQGVRLDAETVDGGSFDACGLITKEIRRKGVDSTWQSAIFLPCSLLDTQIMVELRVTDAVGNENFCWTFVRLEDNVNPNCQPLANEVVTCEVIAANDYGVETDHNDNNICDDAEWTDMTNNQQLAYNETFGNPACADNITCKTFEVEQQYQRIEIACGMAQIKRRYRAIDEQGNIGNWAEQEITVNYTANWSIEIGPDWEGTCNDVIPAPFINIENGACDNLSLSISEQRFESDEDYCIKVERTYQIINNCLLNASTTPFSIPRIVDLTGTVKDTFIINSTTLGTEAHLIYRQILKIRSTDRPNLTMGTVETCLTGHDITGSGGSGFCAEDRTFTANATDCLGDSISNYQWLFYENDTLSDRGTGSSFTKAVLPTIDYAVQFIVTDNCNNQAEERRDFVFTDCVKPTLFTRTGITLELKQREASIRATDFDNGSFDNCTDKETLLRNFRIWHVKLGGSIPTDIGTIRELPSTLTLTCVELASQEVFLFVFDEAGNFDRTENFITVQDNQESCAVAPSAWRLSGNIRNEAGTTIEDVAVILKGETEEKNITDKDGVYTFDVSDGENYTVQPTKVTEPLNGVTTFDLVLISKHILGLTPFKSPYQYIAADINKSGTISAFDLVQLRQLILNIVPDFPNNESWRFIANDYRFTTENPANEAFTEKIYIDNTERGLIELDFVGIKIGDINRTARANSSAPSSNRTNAKTLNFSLDNPLLALGEEITVPFYINDLDKIEGVQFALNFEGLQLIDLREGLANVNHLNAAVSEKGQLRVSWNKFGPVDSKLPLFSLTFKAQKSGWLSNLLTLNKEEMLAEAYTDEEELYQVDLAFTNRNDLNGFELFQNKPNPFSKTTIIPFNLSTTEKVSLKVMDLQGKILYQTDRRYESGKHEIIINKEQLGSAGIIYYQLTAGTATETKKMVVLE